MQSRRGRGRRSVAEIERANVLAELEEIAYRYATDAMTTIGEAASGKPVGREVLGAAQYIINQVLGRPAEKDAPDTQTAQVKDLLEEIIAVRKSAAKLTTAGATAVTPTYTNP